MLCFNGECQEPLCAGVFCRSGKTCAGGWCEQPCTPESDDQFCARLGYDCDPVTAADNCGNSRTADCGTCTAPDTCTGNHCGCIALTCADAGAECGLIFDECESWIFCGDCTLPETCNDSTNTCECASHAAFACYLDDVYWFDSCGNPEAVMEFCDYRCEDAACVDCAACTYGAVSCTDPVAGCTGAECLTECRYNGDVSGGNMCTQWYLADDCTGRTLCCDAVYGCVICR